MTPNKSNKGSPWRKAGGKVRVFRKIIDDEARTFIRRSVHLVSKNKTRRKVTAIKRKSPLKKANKRLLNNSKNKFKKKRINKNNKSKDTHSITTSEEGEICSDIKQSEENTTADTHNIESEEDGDDCVVIEPTLEQITVDDDDDDNDEDDKASTTSDISTNYQSLLNSFQQRISSTPCQTEKTIRSYASILRNCNSKEIKIENVNKEENLPFYVDVGSRSGIESINSTYTLNNYPKLNTLKENPLQRGRSIRFKRNITNNFEAIDLDNSSYNKTNSTLKRKSTNDEDDDDSVIFIGETNKIDFIPINDPNEPAQKVLNISDDTPSTLTNRLHTNNLFTRSETKRLNEYNENAYNPRANEELTTGKRMVIIDGSNVAFKHGLDQMFSVKGLKIAIEYFEKIGHEVKAVIPQFRMNKGKSTDWEELERLHKAGKIVQTPCKNLPGLTSISYDDRFVLQLAFELDAAIVSNDNYRDLLHENPAFKKIIENRVIGYTWCNDIFILPKDPYGKWGPKLHNILNRC